jgi:hypothetical protein
MPTSSSRFRVIGLLWLLAVSVLTELVVLRTVTRTLIHIPGLGEFEAPIRFLAEVGRFAYYVAAVSLIVTLALLALVGLRSRLPRHVGIGAVTIAFLLVAAAGRIGVVPWPIVGWSALALLASAGLLGWRGVRSLPVGLFLAGSVAAGGSVAVQGVGNGLTGSQMDILIWIAEWCFVLAGLTAPLLLKKSPSMAAWAVGGAATLMVIAAFARGASTLSILVLWNVGVPGWLPGVAYALAFAGLVVTAWSAAARGERTVVIGVVLLGAGGVGLFSTYQTGLVLAGVLMLGEVGDRLVPSPRIEPSSQPAYVGSPTDRVAAGAAVPLVVP